MPWHCDLVLYRLMIMFWNRPTCGRLHVAGEMGRPHSASRAQADGTERWSIDGQVGPAVHGADRRVIQRPGLGTPDLE